VAVANNGNVTLSSTTLGRLTDGTGDQISYGQIRTTPRKMTTATVLAAPALADGATMTITVAAVGKIVHRDAKWAYTYLNRTIPPAGTYGGINTNNSRVTYTASLP
jgi:predicted oxidoreductase